LHKLAPLFDKIGVNECNGDLTPIEESLRLYPMKAQLWMCTVALGLASVGWCQDQQKPLFLLVEPTKIIPPITSTRWM
jgi:hypothetical protein